MAFSSKLGELFVEFTEKNAAALQKTIGAVQGGLQKAGTAAQGMGRVSTASLSGATSAAQRFAGATARAATGLATGIGKGVTNLGAGLKKLGGAFSQIGTGAQLAFAAGGAAILGFVRAGLRGSAVGERLSYQFSELNRNIASVFLPTVESFSKAMQKVVDWFRNLSGEQQGMIRRVALLAFGLGGVLTVLPRLIQGLVALKTVTFATAAAMRVLAFSNPFTGLIAAAGILLAVTVDWKSALSDSGEIAMNAGKVAQGALETTKGVVDQIKSAVAGAASELDRLLGVQEAAGYGGLTGSGTEALFRLLALGPLDPNAARLRENRPEDNGLRDALAKILGKLGPLQFGFAGGGNPLISSFLYDLIGKGEKNEKKSEVLPPTGPIENVANAWRRIQERIIKITGGKPVDEKQLEKQEEIRKELEQMNSQLNRIKPSVV